MDGFVVWLTGVEGSGKSAVAREVEKLLKRKGLKVEVLDADEVRSSLSPDLGYTEKDREINCKRLAFMGKVLARNGIVAIIAAVSSFRRFRDNARKEIGRFVEVWVKCPLEVCMERDVKGVYKRAKDIAGVHQPYEEPLNPEVVVDTSRGGPEECAKKIMRKIEDLSLLKHWQ